MVTSKVDHGHNTRAIHTVLIQFLSGLSHASTLFLVASGLSIIFGVTRIVNFAHGAFYMLGAYAAYTLATHLMELWGPGLGFWSGIVLSALTVGLVGVLMEIVLLRRVYHAPELLQLLATFGVVLVVQDAALWLWGREDLFAPRAPGLKGVVFIGEERFPQYHLFLIAVGPLVLGLLWLAFHKTRWGILVRAATEDREMAAALGVNQRWLFTSVVFVGSLLAGLGGALQIPKEAVNLQMDISIIAEAFVVVVIGGMGSITGAFLAALLVGEINAFGVLIFPKSSLVLTFLVMAVVLIIRPHGLLGKPPPPRRASEWINEPALRPADALMRFGALMAIVVMVFLPLVAGEYARVLATELLVLALFAASLHFLMHISGQVSFGHAAYFGVGAYAAALATQHAAAGTLSALLLAPIAAALIAALFGLFCVRLSGVYLAMLTLAFAQIVWSVVFQSAWSGGDNGLLSIWPQGLWTHPVAYYYLTAVVSIVALGVIRHLAFTPFGYALRAGRDSPLRAEATGIDVRRYQWAAFALAGAFAGLAGGLHAFHKGSVFPNLMSIAQSVDALVMVLLGGLQTLIGPVVGAGLYHLLQTEMMRATEYWRLILGLIIIGLVVAFPQGISGYVLSRYRRFDR